MDIMKIPCEVIADDVHRFANRIFVRARSSNASFSWKGFIVLLSATVQLIVGDSWWTVVALSLWSGHTHSLIVFHPTKWYVWISEDPMSSYLHKTVWMTSISDEVFCHSEMTFVFFPTIKATNILITMKRKRRIMIERIQSCKATKFNLFLLLLNILTFTVWWPKVSIR